MCIFNETASMVFFRFSKESLTPPHGRARVKGEVKRKQNTMSIKVSSETSQFVTIQRLR